MSKTAAIRAVIEATPDVPVLYTTGYACRIAHSIRDSDNHFYMTGSMGLIASIGAGVARETGVATVVVDGDGSILMNPVGMIVAGADPTLPLVHIVLDDRRYDSTGGQEVPSARLDLPVLARGSGYGSVHTVGSAAALGDVLGKVLTDCRSPVFIRCVIDEPDEPVPGRIGRDLRSHAGRFGAYLRRFG
ncbi:thiamine pyrophosphate-dependent enzyme [Couchioplanes caeruleus]|uniref:Phosphonopyruvate decarboxylase/sulfopyruvate decarboxylase subunit beta n=1 Tax=Couchioplanes caeruleus TaxID=56438 RepID=A0A3N1GM97_9ACTN|nr:thiamine pyrophosphate-dependent enzyme [Couchioplanes caeruleus]ROP31360.1 phosphonopyruvate decarboxylase/sulfopyruvate decarboxylase subunit beta [Couchioplanes caeruleus]